MRGTFADGPRVTAARIECGLTQEQLATRAGLDVKTVRKAEQGKRLDLATLSRLATALDVTPHKLACESRSDDAHEQTRLEAVRTWVQTWDAQDIDGLLALFHDDAVLSLPGGPVIPFAGTHRGREAIRQAHVLAWANYRTEPVPAADFNTVVCGDTVLLHGVKGVIRPDGEVVRLRSMHLFTFRGDRIIDLKVEFDTLAFSRLTGPPPA